MSEAWAVHSHLPLHPSLAGIVSAIDDPPILLSTVVAHYCSYNLAPPAFQALYEAFLTGTSETYDLPLGLKYVIASTACSPATLAAELPPVDRYSPVQPLTHPPERFLSAARAILCIAVPAAVVDESVHRVASHLHTLTRTLAVLHPSTTTAHPTVTYLALSSPPSPTHAAAAVFAVAAAYLYGAWHRPVDAALSAAPYRTLAFSSAPVAITPLSIAAVPAAVAPFVGGAHTGVSTAGSAGGPRLSPCLAFVPLLPACGLSPSDIAALGGPAAAAVAAAATSVITQRGLAQETDAAVGGHAGRAMAESPSLGGGGVARTGDPVAALVAAADGAGYGCYGRSGAAAARGDGDDDEYDDEYDEEDADADDGGDGAADEDDAARSALRASLVGWLGLCGTAVVPLRSSCCCGTTTADAVAALSDAAVAPAAPSAPIAPRTSSSSSSPDPAPPTWPPACWSGCDDGVPQPARALAAAAPCWAAHPHWLARAVPLDVLAATAAAAPLGAAATPSPAVLARARLTHASPPALYAAVSTIATAAAVRAQVPPPPPLPHGQAASATPSASAPPQSSAAGAAGGKSKPQSKGGRGGRQGGGAAGRGCKEAAGGRGSGRSAAASHAAVAAVPAVPTDPLFESILSPFVSGVGGEPCRIKIVSPISTVCAPLPLPPRGAAAKTSAAAAIAAAAAAARGRKGQPTAAAPDTPPRLDAAPPPATDVPTVQLPCAHPAAFAQAAHAAGVMYAWGAAAVAPTLAVGALGRAASGSEAGGAGGAVVAIPSPLCAKGGLRRGAFALEVGATVYFDAGGAAAAGTAAAPRGCKPLPPAAPFRLSAPTPCVAPVAVQRAEGGTRAGAATAATATASGGCGMAPAGGAGGWLHHDGVAVLSAATECAAVKAAARHIARAVALAHTGGSAGLSHRTGSGEVATAAGHAVAAAAAAAAQRAVGYFVPAGSPPQLAALRATTSASGFAEAAARHPQVALAADLVAASTLPAHSHVGVCSAAPPGAPPLSAAAAERSLVSTSRIPAGSPIMAIPLDYVLTPSTAMTDPVCGDMLRALNSDEAALLVYVAMLRFVPAATRIGWHDARCGWTVPEGAALPAPDGAAPPPAAPAPAAERVTHAVRLCASTWPRILPPRVAALATAVRLDTEHRVPIASFGAWYREPSHRAAAAAAVGALAETAIGGLTMDAAGTAAAAYPRLSAALRQAAATAPLALSASAAGAAAQPAAVARAAAVAGAWLAALPVDAYLYARGIVDSRSFVINVDGAPTPCVIPTADMMNHCVRGGVIGDRVVLAMPTEAASVAKSTTGINTPPTATAVDAAAPPHTTTRCVVFHALVDVPADVEVTMCYGALSAWQSAFYYGFVPPTFARGGLVEGVVGGTATVPTSAAALITDAPAGSESGTGIGPPMGACLKTFPTSADAHAATRPCGACVWPECEAVTTEVTNGDLVPAHHDLSADIPVPPLLLGALAVAGGGVAVVGDLCEQIVDAIGAEQGIASRNLAALTGARGAAGGEGEGEGASLGGGDPHSSLPSVASVVDVLRDVAAAVGGLGTRLSVESERVGTWVTTLVLNGVVEPVVE